MRLKNIKKSGNFKGIKKIIINHGEGDVRCGIDRDDDEFLIVVTYEGEGELFKAGEKVGYKLKFKNPLLLLKEYGKEFVIRKSLDDFRPLVVYVFKMRKPEYS